MRHGSIAGRTYLEHRQHTKYGPLQPELRARYLVKNLLQRHQGPRLEHLLRHWVGGLDCRRMDVANTVLSSDSTQEQGTL